MSTSLSELLTAVSAYGTLKAVKWLEGEEEMALPEEELTGFAARRDIEDHDLTRKEWDQVVDTYLEAVKTEMARRLTGSDPVTSPLPVSVAQDASLTCVDGDGTPQEYNPPTSEVYAKFAVWWDFYCPDPNYGYDPDSKEDHMRAAFWAGYCEGHNRAESASPASSPAAPSVTGGEVKDALEALLKACEGHGTTAVEYSEWQGRMMKAVKNAEDALKNAPTPSVCEVEPLGEVNEHGVLCFKAVGGRMTYISADGGWFYMCSDEGPSIKLTQDMTNRFAAHLQSWLSTGSFDLKGLPPSPPSSEDTELLDWLETQSKASRTGISFDYVRYVEDGQVLEKGYRFMRRHFLGERKDTLRAAIRAARAKEAQQASLHHRREGREYEL